MTMNKVVLSSPPFSNKRPCSPSVLPVQESGQPPVSLDRQRLLLPGESGNLGALEDNANPAFGPNNNTQWKRHSGRAPAKHQGASAVAEPDGADAPASSCVWLSGVPVTVDEEALKEVFQQFGYPQKVRERELVH
jgi:hypothetical protein